MIIYCFIFHLFSTYITLSLCWPLSRFSFIFHFCDWYMYMKKSVFIGCHMCLFFWMNISCWNIWMVHWNWNSYLMQQKQDISTEYLTGLRAFGIKYRKLKMITSKHIYIHHEPITPCLNGFTMDFTGDKK